MKYLITILVITFSAAMNAHGQQGYAEQYATLVAKKMRDSLHLSPQLTTAIFNINIKLEEQKSSVWKNVENEDAVRVSLQQIENLRDEKYREVLNPAQFQLYYQKKQNLVSNN